MLQKKITLSEVIAMEKATISEEEVKKKNVVVVPSTFNGKDIIQANAIAPTKELIAKAGNSIIAYRSKEHKYSDFRGGEYEFPLYILKEVVLPIFIAIFSSWVYDKIKEYKEEKEAQPENPLVKEPTIKVRGYITEKSKYFEIEGTATQVAKEISEQFTKENGNGK
jgi:hypothetical protein